MAARLGTLDHLSRDRPLRMVRSSRGQAAFDCRAGGARRPARDGTQGRGGNHMKKLFILLGSTVLGWVGWAIGAPAGTMAAFMVSMVGTGLGMYVGAKLADRFAS